jgi:hypothetical protein
MQWRAAVAGEHIGREYGFEAEDAALDGGDLPLDPIAQDAVDGDVPVTQRRLLVFDTLAAATVGPRVSFRYICAHRLAEACSCTCRPRCVNASNTSCFSKSSMKPIDSQPKRRRTLVTSSRALVPLLPLHRVSSFRLHTCFASHHTLARFRL